MKENSSEHRREVDVNQSCEGGNGARHACVCRCLFHSHCDIFIAGYRHIAMPHDFS